MSENDTNIMALNSLSNEGTAQNRKRVGRGMGSGTGKTAAFVLPILDKLSKGNTQYRGPRVLIISPTRELASQITESIKKYSRYLKINSITITGGISYSLQNRMFKKPIDILVATPGRLLDLFQQKKIKFLANLEHEFWVFRNPIRFCPSRGLYVSNLSNTWCC